MLELAAHRGGNTMQELRECIEEGYDYAELDVHMTADGFLIVCHDGWKKVGNYRFSVGDMTYQELCNATCQNILLLEEVLEISKNQIGLIIDLKKGRDFYSHIGAKAAELILEREMCRQTWIISFDHESLVDAKKLYPDVRIAPMYVARIYDDVRYWQSIRADGVEICNEYLDKEMIDRAHDKKLRMIGWCINLIDELEWMAQSGVDILTIPKDIRILRHFQEKSDNY